MTSLFSALQHKKQYLLGAIIIFATCDMQASKLIREILPLNMPTLFKTLADPIILFTSAVAFLISGLMWMLSSVPTDKGIILCKLSRSRHHAVVLVLMFSFVILCVSLISLIMAFYWKTNFLAMSSFFIATLLFVCYHLIAAASEACAN